MIKKLKLINFRNFEESEFFFSENQNYIIWENWKWKTNILESLSLLTGNSITWINFDNLVKNSQKFFHIEIENFKENNLVIFFDKEKTEKTYSINKKKTTKKKFNEITLKSVIFSPTTMNLFFLWPNIRRNFLDQILLSTFTEYHKILQNYKKSLLNRNKVLKNIFFKKSDISELKFWDKLFIKNCVEVYKYREIIIKFLIQNSNKLISSFNWKIKKVNFHYLSPHITFSKEEEFKREREIEYYLKENLQRDIILKTTNIWPHRDDFELVLDWNTKLNNFASRWETKSIILWLKNLEIQFIEEQTKRKPILIIDDLLSELDEKHKNIFINSIKWYQTFISWINMEYNKIHKIIKL